MDYQEKLQDFFAFIEESVSPSHCVEAGIRRLQAAGFEELKMEDYWHAENGKKYYVNVRGTSLFAVSINRKFRYGQGFRMAGAHTDWPCFRVKPLADMKDARYHRLNVECYGGPILSTWMDRPLSLAGVVAVRGEDPFHPIRRLVDFGRPVLTIPNLCIHQNRQVNDGVALKKQVDMLPLLDFVKASLEQHSFLDYLAEEIGVSASDILDYDLSVYNMDRPCLCGIQNDMVSSPRLDNLSSCYAALTGLIAGQRESGIDVIFLTDHEEVGSASAQGADSEMFSMLLERLMQALNHDRTRFLEMLPHSLLVSADAAHAIHPNKPATTDPTNPVSLDGGVVMKISYNQRYATDSCVTAIVQGICEKNGIPCQKFVNHSDVRGGSTIGAISSTHLPIPVADIGGPMLAMHSSRELISAKSQLELNQFMTALFQED